MFIIEELLNMSKLIKSKTQVVTEFFGWMLFICIYLGVICIVTALLFWNFDVLGIWSDWSISWKIMACLFYGGGFGLYSYLMWNVAMVFQVISAVLQARLLKTKIWAENMRYNILKEYEEAFNNNKNLIDKIEKVKKPKKQKKDKKLVKTQKKSQKDVIKTSKVSEDVKVKTSDKIDAIKREIGWVEPKISITDLIGASTDANDFIEENDENIQAD